MVKIQIGKDTDTENITFYLIFLQIYIFYFQHLLFNLHKQLWQGPEEEECWPCDLGLARTRSLVTLTMLSHSLHLPDPIQIFQADVLYLYRQICNISWT